MNVVARAAERDAQAGHLDEAAGDQRDARVGAEAEAVGNAGADGQHVLHGAADLDADHVVGGVGPEHVVRQPRGEGAGVGGIAGRNRHGRGQAGGDFAGERGARQDGHRHAGAQLLRRHLVGQSPGAVLEALGGPGQAGACRGPGAPPRAWRGRRGSARRPAVPGGCPPPGAGRRRAARWPAARCRAGSGDWSGGSRGLEVGRDSGPTGSRAGRPAPAAWPGPSPRSRRRGRLSGRSRRRVSSVNTRRLLGLACRGASRGAAGPWPRRRAR